MKSYEIYIDTLTFSIKVQSYTNQPAQGPQADSDWDCYGYEEIEWDCTGVTDCDEDGDEVSVNLDVEAYADLIEEKLLEILKEDAYDDDY